MITRRTWFIVRKRKSLDRPNFKDKWQVKRDGWFLFGIVPLFIEDVAIERIV